MIHVFPDSKVHEANMGPTWVLSAPDGPHVGPMSLAIRVGPPIWHQDSCSCHDDAGWFLHVNIRLEIIFSLNFFDNFFIVTRWIKAYFYHIWLNQHWRQSCPILLPAWAYWCLHQCIYTTQGGDELNLMNSLFHLILIAFLSCHVQCFCSHHIC